MLVYSLTPDVAIQAGEVQFVFFTCTEKLIGEKLEATEVSQSEIGQKQKLRVVLDKINRILNLPPQWSHAKWSVDSKLLPSIMSNESFY